LLLRKSKGHIVTSTHIVVLFLVLLSLSRPIIENTFQKASVDAKDIIIALDVSYSMQAKDIKPSRYAFAKKTIAELLKVNPSDNVMLMAFTTNPLLLSPPTTDHRLINIALESLNPKFILTKGTSLQKLFTKLSTMHIGHKNLLLITDGGEEHELEKLSSLVLSSNVSLTILALGTTSGTTVTKEDGSYLKDKKGNLVISRINPLLESLASVTGSTYIEASNSPSLSAKKISQVLQDNSRKTQEAQKLQKHYLELYQIPLSLAILLFLLVHTRAVKYLLFLFTFFGFQVHASTLDTYRLSQAYAYYEKSDFNNTMQKLKEIKTRSLQSQMMLANTYYKQKNFKKAIKIYKSIHSTSMRVKQNLYYNIANAYARQEVYTKAKMYYTKALQLGLDADATHNLKLIVLLEDKKNKGLGIAHPKSQDGSSAQSESQDKKKSKNEDEPSSGSGGAGENSEQKKQKKSKLLEDKNPQKHPLSSKVYELINKGYIHETQPW